MEVSKSSRGWRLLMCLALMLQGPVALAGPVAGEADPVAFSRTVSSSWELARAGRLEEALNTLAESGERITDPEQRRKLRALTLTFAIMKQRGETKAAAAPTSPTPAPLSAQAPPPASAAEPAVFQVPPPPQGSDPAPVIGKLTAPVPRQAGWEYSVGPEVRFGGQVKFTGRKLVRPDGGAYVNGRHTDGMNYAIAGDIADAASQEKLSPQLDPIGWQTVDPNGIPGSGDETHFRNVTFDQSTLTDESTDLHTAWGVSGQVRRTFERDHFLLSSLTLGLSLSHSEAETSATSGRGVATRTLTGILSRTGATVPANTEPRTPYAVTNGQPAGYNMTDNLFDLGGGATTATTVELEAETLLLTLRLGGQRDFTLTPWLRLWVGAGPTLNIAMLTTDCEQRATWQAPANPLDGTPVQGFADSESGSEYAILPGAFGAVGLRLQLATHLALDAGLTYDWVFGEIEGEQASVNFANAFNAQLRLIFDF